MDLKQAIVLLENATIAQDRPQRWADLGCGAGTFTRALAQLLPAGSTIYAVDRSEQLLPSVAGEVSIRFSLHDFEKDAMPFHELDGILLANALHYCEDAEGVLERLMIHQTPGNEQFLIAEYDSVAANRWVPYPLSFQRISGIFASVGLPAVTRLGERPSLFRREKIYTCQATRG